MAKNLVSCWFNVVFGIRRIGVHDGISSSLIDVFNSPSTRPTGLTFDGINLISGDATAPRKIYVHIGVTFPWSDSFATECASSPDLAYDGANLNLISAFGHVHDIICVHVGISSVIEREFVTPASNIGGITYDGANLISSDIGTNKIYIHDGISSTISSSFASPAGSPQGLTMAEGDLISCDSAANTVYVHDGISASIKSTFIFADLLGLTYTNPPLPPTAPTDLLCNDRTNPMDLGTTTPYFSAIYNDPNEDDIAQNFRIQVNNVENFGGTNLWDSGKREMDDVNEGERCENINYEGSTLSLDTIYYWRIKFWDDEDLEGVWSEAAHFKISLRSPTDLWCEQKTNPADVTDPRPEFSAIYHG